LSLKEKGDGVELLWEADVNRPVMGFYNQVDCFMLDEIVSLAEIYGIHLQLCLLTRKLYMDKLKDENSPEYDKAIRYAKKLLRYEVARWGVFNDRRQLGILERTGPKPPNRALL